MWIYVNDRFVRKDEAVVSVFDHGFLYGDGIYETLRSYNGSFFMLGHHLTRLYRSAELIGLRIPILQSDWHALLQEALSRNALSDAYIRITISRGEGAIGLDPRLCAKPTIVIVCLPLPSYTPQLFQLGVNLVVVDIRRNLSSALSPQIKSLNFLNNILAKQEAARRGAFDGVMLNHKGEVTECTTSNILFVKNGCLCTPAVECGILDGITREIVLLLAREDALKIDEGSYAVEQLKESDECFLTNTTMEIMPVREIDGERIGEKTPGPITQRLQELFRKNLSRFLR